MHEGRRVALFVALCAIVCGCGDDPRAHLVGWWKFDEGAGTFAADASGHGNLATIVNGGWGLGHSANALAMNGGNDGIVTIPLSDSLRSTADEITVAAWTYRDATHNVAVISHGYPTLFFGFHGPQFKWAFERANGRGTDCYADPKYEAGLGKWIHVAATYDGWTAKLYADGVEVCRRWSYGAIAMPPTPFTLSGYVDDSGRIVDEITGRLDDVRIYDRALTGDEIRSLAARSE